MPFRAEGKKRKQKGILDFLAYGNAQIYNEYEYPLFRRSGFLKSNLAAPFVACSVLVVVSVSAAICCQLSSIKINKMIK